MTTPPLTEILTTATIPPSSRCATISLFLVPRPRHSKYAHQAGGPRARELLLLSVEVPLLPKSGWAVQKNSGKDAPVRWPQPHRTGEAPRHNILLTRYPTTRLSKSCFYSFVISHIPPPPQVIPFLVLSLGEEIVFAELLAYTSESGCLQVYFLFNLDKHLVNYPYVAISTEEKGRLWRIRASPGSP